MVGRDTWSAAVVVVGGIVVDHAWGRYQRMWCGCGSVNKGHGLLRPRGADDAVVFESRALWCSKVARIVRLMRDFMGMCPSNPGYGSIAAVLVVSYARAGNDERELRGTLQMQKVEFYSP